MKSLVPKFDALIENMMPGKMAALGLGEQVCRSLNPSLIYASISGFGSGGLWVDRPAYDTIGLSIGGIYSIMNDADHRRLTGTCIADLITGVSSAMGILAALLGRERSGDRKGMLMETSLHEAMSLLTIDALTRAYENNFDPVRTSRHPQAQNFCLNCADGGAITMHLSVSQKLWGNLARLIGSPELVDDPRYRSYDDRRVPEYSQERARAWGPPQVAANAPTDEPSGKRVKKTKARMSEPVLPVIRRERVAAPNKVKAKAKAKAKVESDRRSSPATADGCSRFDEGQHEKRRGRRILFFDQLHLPTQVPSVRRRCAATFSPRKAQ